MAIFVQQKSSQEFQPVLQIEAEFFSLLKLSKVKEPAVQKCRLSVCLRHYLMRYASRNGFDLGLWYYTKLWDEVASCPLHSMIKLTWAQLSSPFHTKVTLMSVSLILNDNMELMGHFYRDIQTL